MMSHPKHPLTRVLPGLRAATAECAARDPARAQAMIDECFRSEDYREGREACAAKRKPEFKGK